MNRPDVLPLQFLAPPSRGLSPRPLRPRGTQAVGYNAKTNVVELEPAPGRVEWGVFNPEAPPVKVHSLGTNQTLVYLIPDKP